MSNVAIICIVFFCVIAVVAVALILFARIRPHLYKQDGTDFSTREGKVEFIVPKVGTPYLIKRKADGSISDEGFKILTCADMHIKDDAELSLTLLARFLDMEKPDLVVLVGDNVVGRTDTVMQERLKTFFEERKQYWGFVLGNHDSERKIKNDIKAIQNGGQVSPEQAKAITAENRKWMFDTLSGGEYCIVKDEKNLYGSGNCVVNIKSSKGISQSLFFFDSGDYAYGVRRKAIGTEKRCYDYLHEDQLAWYRQKLEETARENNGIVSKSIAFFHIPLPEFQKAFRESRLHSKNAKLIYGTNYERACSSDIDVGAFETFRALGSTQIIVCGHDHKNDSCIEYKGIRLTYSQGLQYNGAYNRRKKAGFLRLLNRISDKLCCFTEGVSLFMVKCDGEVNVAARYAQKEGLYYGLEKHFESAFLSGTVKKVKNEHGADRRLI